MGQQSKVDDFLAAVAKLDEQLNQAISDYKADGDKNIRNKRGIEIHGHLHKLKVELDAMPDADPDVKRMNDAFIPLVKKLLSEIFETEVK